MEHARRGLGGLLIGALLLQAGCAGGPRLLSRDELVSPPPARSFLVTTGEGMRHTFVALHLEGDMLVGTARITVRETVGEGDAARETVTNRYEERRIPWAEVASVEADRGSSSAGGGWLLAAGSVALGLGVFFLMTQGDDEPAGGGGGGKDF